MVPEPITSELWSEVTSNLRTVRMDRLSEIDGSGDPQESLSRRAKQPAAGGQMIVYSSKIGTQRAVNPLQPPSPALGRKVRPLSPGCILAGISGSGSSSEQLEIDKYLENFGLEENARSAG